MGHKQNNRLYLVELRAMDEKTKYSRLRKGVFTGPGGLTEEAAFKQAGRCWG